MRFGEADIEKKRLRRRPFEKVDGGVGDPFGEHAVGLQKTVVADSLCTFLRSTRSDMLHPCQR